MLWMGRTAFYLPSAPYKFSKTGEIIHQASVKVQFQTSLGNLKENRRSLLNQLPPAMLTK